MRYLLNVLFPAFRCSTETIASSDSVGSILNMRSAAALESTIIEVTPGEFIKLGECC